MAIFKFLLFCIVLMSAGCGKTPEETVTEETIDESGTAEITPAPVKKEISETEETEKGKYSISTGDNAEIPEGFPTDIYIYRPSSVTAAIDTPEGSILGLTTDDDVSTITETYKREMAANSWLEQTSVKHEEQLILVYEKEQRIAHISITPMDGATQIGVKITKN